MKGASHKKLRWEEGCEVHVEAGLRGLHIGGVHGVVSISGHLSGSVDGLDVIPLDGMPIRVASHRWVARMERAVGKAVGAVAVEGGLRRKGLSMAMPKARGRGHRVGALHSKHMGQRRDSVARIC